MSHNPTANGDSVQPEGHAESLRRAAFDGAAAITRQAVPRGPNAVVAGVAKAYAMADGLWASALPRQAENTGCGTGCAWCCHQRVGATVTEVFHVADHLRRHPDGAQLIRRLEAWAGGRPCLFLVDGRCAIYEQRPLKCRGIYQMDSRWCMETFAKLEPADDAAPPRHDCQRDPKDIFDGAFAGLAHPLRQTGHDAPGVDFVPALKAVIGDPWAAWRWWQGETVFPAEVRLHDSMPSPDGGNGEREADHDR